LRTLKVLEKGLKTKQKPKKRNQPTHDGGLAQQKIKQKIKRRTNLQTKRTTTLGPRATRCALRCLFVYSIGAQSIQVLSIQ
jgi:hypothetical protein